MNADSSLRRAAGAAVLALLLLPGGCGPGPVDRPVFTLKKHQPTRNVCPPFALLDEEGRAINPATGENADQPYSPAKTCGKCHDYKKITEGYHFTQGAGEKAPDVLAARCQWVSTPGNFGGTWCSPAPLYRYLSPKENASASTMDMSAFTFLSSGCGACHPGGGSAEFDRDGKRYDHRMRDPAAGFTPGGDNRFDGDYYQARWSETGVLEADCLICHLPGYKMEERNRQIRALNFRWAPSAGSGLAQVTGSVQEGKPVTVAYDKTRFRPDGTVRLNLVRQPRNEACLGCHAQPGWKKRGANFRARTDVHLRAGMRCVDCHPAGSSADDPRLNGREEHQIAKGDEPSGRVRDDLDGTVRDCTSCHSTGFLGAPIAKHPWLPPLHLEKIACQTCHIPERLVMPIDVQASDRFNQDPYISPGMKQLWTFYGPDRRYRNHYGILETTGYDDKPTEPFRPILARYKGKIYPVNRVHSTWPGIETEGKPGLMMPRPGDLVKMWTTHLKNPSRFPELAKIKDDNGDGVPEVNRPEEIDALIASVTAQLKEAGYPMEGKRVVWVMNDRVYSSGTRYREVPKQPWEASPYGNVHKYSHDVFPARAALGAHGCTDCHSPSASFFFGAVLKYPFDESAKPVVEPQYQVLGIGSFWARLGAWREAYLKPILYGLLVLLGCLLAGWLARLALAWGLGEAGGSGALRFVPWLIVVACALGALTLALQPGLAAYMLPTRFQLDANHFLVAVLIVGAGLLALLAEVRAARAGGPGPLPRPPRVATLAVVLALAVVSGIGMLARVGAFVYTVFDAALVLAAAGVAGILARRLAPITGKTAGGGGRG